MSLFGFGKKKQATAEPVASVSQSRYKILGTGCTNCDALARNVAQALEELDINDGIEKVSQLSEIAKYGVMSVPAFVIDDKVVSIGKVLTLSEIKQLVQEN